MYAHFGCSDVLVCKGVDSTVVTQFMVIHIQLVFSALFTRAQRK